MLHIFTKDIVVFALFFDIDALDRLGLDVQDEDDFPPTFNMLDKPILGYSSYTNILLKSVLLSSFFFLLIITLLLFISI